MLIIAIHGFRAKIRLSQHIPFLGKFLGPEPDTWKTAKRFSNEFKKRFQDLRVKLHRLGYKDIIYKDHKRWFFWEKGRKKTLSEIKTSIAKHGSPVIILGHSLGGWAANVLVDELLATDDEGTIGGRLALIQIDALPLTKNSPVISENWISEKPTGIFFNLLINAIADFLDNIDPRLIYDSYLKETNGVLRHKKTYSSAEVFLHLNFYCKKDSWDLTNYITHLATKEEVGPIEQTPMPPNLQNIEVAATHEIIDKPEYIFDNAPDRLYSIFKE